MNRQIAGIRRSKRKGSALLAAFALISLAILFSGSPFGSRAAGPNKRVADLSASVTCPTCGGEPISTSASPVAAVMKTRIASAVEDGRTDAQVIAILTRGYGRGIVLDPPVSAWLPLMALLSFVAPVSMIGLMLSSHARPDLSPRRYEVLWRPPTQGREKPRLPKAA